MRRFRNWLRTFDRCRYGHAIWSHGGYDLCRKHWIAEGAPGIDGNVRNR